MRETTDNPVNESSEDRYSGKKKRSKMLWVWLLFIVLLIQLFLSFYYDHEPEIFDVMEVAERHADLHNDRMVTGYVTAATFMEVTDILLHKRGGYMSNDVLPPFVFMDNVPNWEFGVLVQVRDLARTMRNDISRAQSIGKEDKDLANAEPKFNYDNDSWIFPTTESQYKQGQAFFHAYLERLSDDNDQDAQFFARTDNLVSWLTLVEKRLGDISQQLSASVGEERINTDNEGDREATYSTYRPSELRVKTSWLEIDDNFYQARGTTWALIHFLKAVEIDFEGVLKDKNALVSLRQIIRELEATQDTIWTPMVLNGSGFGFFANHSLVMSSYISRANAGVIDLRRILEKN